VQRVTDIIGEITAASTEQSDGISQINTSVVQLDQMTQQNAALVEESAAAAESLKDQAAKLAKAVGTFKLDASQPPATTHFVATPPMPAAAAAPAAKPRRAEPALAAAKPAARPAAPQPAPTPPAPRVTEPKPAPRAASPAPAPASSASDDEWETF